MKEKVENVLDEDGWRTDAQTSRCTGVALSATLTTLLYAGLVFGADRRFNLMGYYILKSSPFLLLALELKNHLRLRRSTA